MPLVSYAVLRGRCRHCGASISWRYPAVEAVTALLVAGCALKFGFTWDFADRRVVLCRRSSPISATDLERRIIPNRIVLPAAVVVLVAQHAARIRRSSGSRPGSARSAFFLLAALAYPAGMGMGDVKLALLLGVVPRPHGAGGDA